MTHSDTKTINPPGQRKLLIDTAHAQQVRQQNQWLAVSKEIVRCQLVKVYRD